MVDAPDRIVFGGPVVPNNTLVILEARETVGRREETGVAAADAA